MPVVTMIAGPNGSGKSTLTRLFADSGLDFGEYLNADDIAAGMDGPLEEVAQKAQAEVRRRREAALLERRDYSFETVMSHPSHIEHLREAKAAGYEVLVYFVATDDPWINQGRVANRVKHGGHNVPRDRIAARYNRCLANLPDAVAVADGGLIFDNSDTERPMLALAEIEDGHIGRVLGSSPGSSWFVKVLRSMNK